MNGVNEMTELLKGKVLVDASCDLWRVLGVAAPDGEALLIAEGAGGQIRLFEVADVKNETYELFTDEAGAKAFVAKLNPEDEAKAA